jgi:hypothetical protein
MTPGNPGPSDTALNTKVTHHLSDKKTRTVIEEKATEQEGGAGARNKSDNLALTTN